MNSSFVIAAPSSCTGKTTVSLGLMRALTRQGLSVRPFKCGPDYIDTQFHRVACGMDSINLDTFMSSTQHVDRLFDKYSADADVSIVEGVMGMFDGYSRMEGSSADIARMLDIPVILVVNAASTAYSIGALLYGFKNFRQDVRVAGVILNRVASESHFSFLKDACDDAGVRCLGYLSKCAALQTPSRHLGLTLTAVDDMNRFIDRAADMIEQSVDLSALLNITQYTSSGNGMRTVTHCGTQRKLTIAVARDEAFNFIYLENIEALRCHPRYDVSIRFFSPLHDKHLPEADFLYLPGGYPELFAPQLSDNRSMRGEIRSFINAGGMTFAECGGMIYLCDEIDGARMCGVIPAVCTMKKAKLTLGYRKLTFGDMEFRGHEFHYSRLVNPDVLPSAAILTDIKNREVATPVYRCKNAVAGYTHIYWGDNDILKLWNL